jgi:hypothetical protein
MMLMIMVAVVVMMMMMNDLHCEFVVAVKYQMPTNPEGLGTYKFL